MALISVPSILAFQEGTTLTLQRSNIVYRSIMTGKRQVSFTPYAVWILEGSLIPYEGTDAGLIKSFFAKLQGQRNTFNISIPGVSTPISGYAGSTPLVNGAGQTGNSLVVDGLTASVPFLAEGDYFNVNGEAKQVTASVSSNGSGQATISFEPALRVSPADNAALVINQPTITMAAQDDNIASASFSVPYIHNFTLKAMEAF